MKSEHRAQRSEQSHKSKWEKSLLKSGLGHRAVGTGLAMVVYANADGTRMFPSMRTLANDMGCDKKYVTEGRATLAEYGWAAFVAKGIPGQRGDEYFPTFGRHHRSVSGTHDRSVSGTYQADEIGPSQDGDRSVSGGDRSLSGSRQVPERVITMEKHHVLNHEEHHGPTPESDATYAAALARTEAKDAALAEAIKGAPDF